ncbi:MAG: Smr/MutS family protein [Bacteroidia bacterium]|nr:Smr/MutS family protein [Bacteroidia bacterium]
MGEGVIIALLDARTVEVDFGDDFPIDMDIDDIIPVDGAESKYHGGSAEGSTEENHDPDVRKPLTLGSALLDVSLVFVARDDDRYKLIMANPEPTQVLYAVYLREKNRYQGLASGLLNSGTVKEIATLSGAELDRTRSFLVQVINYVPGKGHPHSPLTSELPWTRNSIRMPARFLEAVGEPAWVFSLRKNIQQESIETLASSEFLRVTREEQPQREVHLEADLHLEELVDYPDKIPAGEALRIQLEEVARVLSDALVNHASSLVLIHGIGEGKLRQEVHAMLKRTPHVKSFEAADSRKYGQGATKVFFQ